MRVVNTEYFDGDSGSSGTRAGPVIWPIRSAVAGSSSPTP